jgi:uncharacterized protein (TIRG00374 family)
VRQRITWKARLFVHARYLVGLGLGGLALWAVAGQRGELTGATSELSHLQVGWLLLGIFAELLSVVAFSRMQARLLRAGGGDMPPARILGITFAAGAIASSLPAGPAVSSLYAYRQYRRCGADQGVATWTLLATLISSALGLALLATAGLLVAEQQGAALDLVGVTIAVLALAVFATVLLWQRRLVTGLLVWGLKLVHRVTKLAGADSADTIERVRSHLQRVHLTGRQFLPALAWSVGNWAFDCGCLVCGYMAVGAAIPWRGLLLAYGAGQLASNLPITPGGLGVVEGSLTIALVAYGGAQVSTVAAVILYRIVSFWGYLPVGWAIWAGIAYVDRRRDRRVREDVGVNASAGEGRLS